MSIEELLNQKGDVLIKEIPDEWQLSYKKFLFGQSYYKNENGDSVTHYSDFYNWYLRNRKELDREINIDKIIGDVL